jgi:hypothetical protein
MLGESLPPAKMNVVNHPQPALHFFAAVPLKSTTRIGAINPTVLAPDSKRLSAFVAK